MVPVDSLHRLLVLGFWSHQVHRLPHLLGDIVRNVQTNLAGNGTLVGTNNM